MNYTKEDLQKGEFNYFVMLTPEQRDIIGELFKRNGFIGNEILTCVSFEGSHLGYMDDDGTYYKNKGFTEVFPYELTFLNESYELY